MSQRNIAEEKKTYSEVRLAELSRRLEELREFIDCTGLTVFAAGSYARLEASRYSDIDLFFVQNGLLSEVDDPRTKSIRLFGRLIQVADQMSFPKFSNDSEYLQVLELPRLLENIGGRVDDHLNYFTTRMLLLLEGRCVAGKPVHEQVLQEIVDSYFRDYRDHQTSFTPTFLLNDVHRFWTTLKLNYENRRNLRDADENKRIKHKVKNFKLKFSRLTTCFATVSALGSYKAPVRQEEVIELAKMPPRDRLLSVEERIPSAGRVVEDLLEQYDWFLEVTSSTTEELESKFSDKQRRVDMFGRANQYGDTMYRLLQTIDSADDKLQLLRYWTI